MKPVDLPEISHGELCTPVWIVMGRRGGDAMGVAGRTAPILQLCSIGLLVISVAASASALELQVSPARPSQGDAVLVRAVCEPGAVKTCSGSFAGRSLRFRPGRSLGVFWALAGVPVSYARKAAPLRVQATGAKGSKSRSLSVPVGRRMFRKEHLSLPKRMVHPPKTVLARIRAERKAVRKSLARRSKATWMSSFCPPMSSTISSTFGKRRFMNGIPKGRHWGVDLRGRIGWPVKACQSAQVAFVQDLYFSGLTVILDHGEGLFSLYFHLSKARVKAGTFIERGAVIGEVGASGRVTGAHLHWEMRLDKLRLDPFSFCRLPLDPVSD